MARNPISSGQNENLRPLFNSNRGIVTIEKWSQNLILTTRIVNNGCLGVFRPNKAQTPISDYSSGQNQILITSNYFLIVTIPLLLLKSGLRFSFRQLEIKVLAILHIIGQKWQKMAIYGHEPHKNGSKYSKPPNSGIVEVVKHFRLVHSSINQQTNSTVGISPLQNFLAHMHHMCRVYCQLHKFLS